MFLVDDDPVKIELQSIISQCIDFKNEGDRTLQQLSKQLKVTHMKQEGFDKACRFMDSMKNAESHIVKKAYTMMESVTNEDTREANELAREFRQNQLLVNNKYKPRKMRNKPQNVSQVKEKDQE